MPCCSTTASLHCSSRFAHTLPTTDVTLGARTTSETVEEGQVGQCLPRTALTQTTAVPGRHMPDHLREGSTSEVNPVLCTTHVEVSSKLTKQTIFYIYLFNKMELYNEMPGYQIFGIWYILKVMIKYSAVLWKFGKHIRYK